MSFSSMPKHVINRLYIDMDPVDPATGRPANNWRLLSEYEDVDGKSTGKYASVVDWGGWQTTFRTDGFRSLDFMLVSLREIIPPQ